MLDRHRLGVRIDSREQVWIALVAINEPPNIFGYTNVYPNATLAPDVCKRCWNASARGEGSSPIVR